MAAASGHDILKFVTVSKQFPAHKLFENDIAFILFTHSQASCHYPVRGKSFVAFEKNTTRTP
jgi:hypothetical protein